MCTDCFKIVAGVALLDDDFLTFRFIIFFFFTSSEDTKVNLNVSGTISG